MITISAFADEASPDLKVQMDILESMGVRNIDVRGIDSVNVSTFTNAQAAGYRKQMDDRGFVTACIGSPIGKIRLDEPMAPHMNSLARCIEIAHIMGTKFIRVFSFFAPKDGDFSGARDEVFARTARMIEAAKAGNIVLLHENEHDVYGRTGVECLDIMKTFGCDNFKFIFDPANFVVADVKPYDDAWTRGLADLTYWFHIKDTTRGEKSCRPAGEGEGQFNEIFADLKRRNWSGVMTVEPHLASWGVFSGHSGEQLFRLAVTTLQKMLDGFGMKYS